MSALTRSLSRGLRPITSASPFRMLSEEIDDLLSRFGESWDGGEWSIARRAPSLDLSESDGTLEVTMDVPGMNADEIDIEVTGDTLSISGEHEEEKKEEGKRYHRVERRRGAFQRSVALPCSVNDAEVSAEYKDGVLTITLPKTEAARSHKVSIRT